MNATKRISSTSRRCSQCPQAGFTLVEVVVCILIIFIVFAGVVNAYVQAGRRAEWSAYSLAAQALAIQQLEQAHAATYRTTGVNQIASLQGVSTNVLDVPMSGANLVIATNYVRVVTRTFGLASVQMVQVDTVWPFHNGRLYTNSIATYLAPD